MMKNNFYVALCIIGTGLVAASCHEHSTEQAANLFAVQGDTITVASHSHLKDRLKTITLKDEPYRLQIITTGVIKAIPTQYAEIAPPFPGKGYQNVFAPGHENHSINTAV